MDIPEGILHECTVPKEGCSHIAPTPGSGPENQKWEPIIWTFFRMIKRGTTVRKPRGLDLNTTYVRTDIMVLKTLLLHFPRLAGKSMFVPATRLVFEDVGQVTTAYLTPAPFDSHIQRFAGRRGDHARLGARLELTKKETERILDGHPPYYAETLDLVNGSHIQHPIQTVEDIYRGGWIVAVGLSRTLRTVSHRMKDLAKEEPRLPMAVRKAFARVIHGLKNAEKAFPQERYIRSATKCVDIFASGQRDSRTYSRIIDSEVSKEIARSWNYTDVEMWLLNINAKDYAMSLSNEQCHIAIQAFNHYEDQFRPWKSQLSDRYFWLRYELS
jgi:hypothetical protein